MLLLDVQDQNYSKHLERFLGRTKLVAFVCGNTGDAKVLMNARKSNHFRDVNVIDSSGFQFVRSFNRFVGWHDYKHIQWSTDFVRKFVTKKLLFSWVFHIIKLLEGSRGTTIGHWINLEFSTKKVQHCINSISLILMHRTLAYLNFDHIINKHFFQPKKRRLLLLVWPDRPQVSPSGSHLSQEAGNRHHSRFHQPQFTPHPRVC